MKYHESLIVPKAHSDIHSCRAVASGTVGRYKVQKLGASEILIRPKRAQRSNTGYISHLREPGTASWNRQEQNGFHLALLSAAVANCQGNTNESIRQLVNTLECRLALAPTEEEESLHF